MFELSQFHRHMEYDRNTMIWAPRQSGKSFALCRKFVESRDTLLFSPRRPMARHLDDLLVDLGCPDRRRDVHVMRNDIGDVLRGRYTSAIFIDEIDHYDGDLASFLESTTPATSLGTRLVAVSTPVRVQHAGLYDSFFPNNIHVEDRVLFSVPKEHFEEELFTI